MPTFGLEGLVDAVLALVRENQHLVAPTVFVLGLAESLVLVSILVPSTVLFIGIGAAHSAAGGEFVPVWLAGATGAMLGDVISFAAGRALRNDLPRYWPFSRYPRLLARGRLMFARWGGATILFAKFMGTMRPFLPVVAGAMRMRWPVFLFASFASSLLWAGVFLAPGYGLALLGS